MLGFARDDILVVFYFFFRAHLVPSPDVIDPKWLEGVTRVVVSASASTPEALTTQVMQRLADLGVEVQSEALAVNETKPTWKLPK